MTPELLNHPYFAIATTVITVASAIAAVLPKPKSKGLAVAYRVIHVLALNVKNAKRQ